MSRLEHSATRAGSVGEGLEGLLADDHVLAVEQHHAGRGAVPLGVDHGHRADPFSSSRASTEKVVPRSMPTAGIGSPSSWPWHRYQSLGSLAPGTSHEIRQIGHRNAGGCGQNVSDNANDPPGSAVLPKADRWTGSRVRPLATPAGPRAAPRPVETWLRSGLRSRCPVAVPLPSAARALCPLRYCRLRTAASAATRCGSAAARSARSVWSRPEVVETSSRRGRRRLAGAAGSGPRGPKSHWSAPGNCPLPAADSPLLSALCPLPSALCPLPSALCRPPSTSCTMASKRSKPAAESTACFQREIPSCDRPTSRSNSRVTSRLGARDHAAHRQPPVGAVLKGDLHRPALGEARRAGRGSRSAR